MKRRTDMGKWLPRFMKKQTRFFSDGHAFSSGRTAFLPDRHVIGISLQDIGHISADIANKLTDIGNELRYLLNKFIDIGNGWTDVGNKLRARGIRWTDEDNEWTDCRKKSVISGLNQGRRNGWSMVKMMAPVVGNNYFLHFLFQNKTLLSLQSHFWG